MSPAAIGTVANALVSSPTAAASLILYQNTHLYIAPLSGSDSNAGTIAAPLATMAGAWAKLPFLAFDCQYVILHFAQGNAVNIAPMPGYVALNPHCEIVIWCDGAGQADEDGFTELASGLISADPTTEIRVGSTTGGFGFQQWRGRTLEVVIGGETHYRDIQDNGPDIFYLNNPLPGIPTGAWRVVEPATRFDMSAMVTYLQTPGMAKLTVINPGFDDDGNGTELVLSNARMLRMFGWHFIETGQIRTENCALVLGGNTSAKIPEAVGEWEDLWTALGANYSARWDGWGVSSHDYSPMYNYLNGNVNIYDGYFTCMGILSVGSRVLYSGFPARDGFMAVRIRGGTSNGAWGDGLGYFEIDPNDALFDLRGPSSMVYGAMGAQIRITAKYTLANNGVGLESAGAFMEVTDYQIDASGGIAVGINAYYYASQIHLVGAVDIKAFRPILISGTGSVCQTPDGAVLTADAGGDCANIVWGATMRIRGSLTLNGGEYGLNANFGSVSGGTIIVCDEAPTFAGQSLGEIKVSPLLISTYALAVPNQGDAYSSPGAGSRIIRAY